MLKYSEDLNGLRHLKHSNHGSPDLRPPFCILHKKNADLAALHASFVYDLLWGEELLLLNRNFINCLLKHCEIWNHGQIFALKVTPI